METQVKLQFEKFDSFISEVSANVSLGGMFIRTDAPVPVGSMLGFELMLADDFKLIQGRGEVVWVRTIEEGPDRPPGMGIRFRELDTASRELIYKIVYHRMKEGQKPFDLAGGARKGIGGVPAGIAAPVARAGEEAPTPAARAPVVARVMAPAPVGAAGGPPPAPADASSVAAPPAAAPAPPRPPSAPVPARAPLSAIRLTTERPILNLPLAAAEPPPAPVPRSRQAGLEGVDPRSSPSSPSRPAARSASPPAIVPQPLPELPAMPPAGEPAPPSAPPVQLAIPAPAPEPPPVASAPALQPTAPQPVRPGRPAVSPPSLADDEVSFRGLRLSTEDLPERAVSEVAAVREPAPAGRQVEPAAEPAVAVDEPVVDEAATDQLLAVEANDGDVLGPLPAELDTGPQPRSYPDPPDLAAWRDVAWALVDESAGDAVPAPASVAPEPAAEPVAEPMADASPFEPEPWSAIEPGPLPAAPESLPLELHAEPELLPSLAAVEESSAAWTPTTDELRADGWGALVVAPEATPESPPSTALHAAAGDAEATVAFDARAWRPAPPEREVLSMDTVGMAVESTPPLAESPRVTAAMILSALESEARREGEAAPAAPARPAPREESAAEAEARIASIYGVATERPRPAAGGWAVALVTVAVLAGVGYVFRAPIVALLGLDRPGQVPPGSNLPVDEETGLPVLPNLEQARAGAEPGADPTVPGATAGAAGGAGATAVAPASGAAPDWPAATPPAPPAGAERGAGRPVTPVAVPSSPPASPPSAATVTPPVPATPAASRPPAAGSVDGAVVAPALPAQRFRRVLAIEHRQEGERTVVVIRGDGGFPVKSWARYRIDGEQPRELFKLYGVEQPFRVARVEVGTAQVLQVRSGNHPNELHVVLDLAGRARKVTDVAAVGSTLEITVE